METLANFASGFESALTLTNILLVFLGAFFGTVIGMLPGIGPVNAIAILFPVVYSLGLSPTSALILFAGIFYGSQYGNSISSVLLNIPGTSASAVTAIDGYALTKQGKGGQALAMSAIASFIGGTLSIFLLIFFSPLLARFAIDFGPAEYTVLILFSFIALAGFSEGSLAKTMISAFFGLFIAAIGIDPITGVERFTFGYAELSDGIHFIVVVIGFFAISELLELIVKPVQEDRKIGAINSLKIRFKSIMASLKSIIRSCLSGFLVGVLPGAGATIASFFAYATEKKLLPNNKFGKGDINGVAAPESANNSSAVGSFIPLLILGVPGSETTAVMLGSLISLGVSPGPLFLQEQANIFWALAASMFIGNLFLIILNLPLVRFFVMILKTPKWILLPLIAILSIIGVYTSNASTFDIILMAIFGVIGWIMRRLKYPLAPLVLGVVLGTMLETNFRRSMLYSDGSWTVFFNTKILITLWILIVFFLFIPVLKRAYKNLKSK